MCLRNAIIYSNIRKGAAPQKARADHTKKRPKKESAHAGKNLAKTESRFSALLFFYLSFLTFPKSGKSFFLPFFCRSILK